MGYDERFIRPIRELKERDLEYDELLKVVGTIFRFESPDDKECVEIQERLTTDNLHDLVVEYTGLSDESLIEQIVDRVILTGQILTAS